MTLGEFLPDLQKQTVMATSFATFLTSDISTRPKPSAQDILNAQSALNGSQLFIEHAFHSMFLVDQLDYCTYIMIVCPTRFSEPMNQILESKGFAVERERFTPTEANYLVNRLTSPQLGRLMKAYYLKATPKQQAARDLATFQMPYRLDESVINALKELGPIRVKHYDGSLIRVPKAEGEAYAKYLRESSVHSTFTQLLEQGYYIGPGMLDMHFPELLPLLSNFRTQPVIPERKTTPSNYLFDFMLNIPMALDIMQGKYVSCVINETMQRLIYRLSCMKIREDLTVKEVGTIIFVYGVIKMPNLSYEDSLLFLLCGYLIPCPKSYIDLITARVTRSVHDPVFKKFRSDFYCTGHTELGIEMEESLFKVYSAKGLRGVIEYLGGVIPYVDYPLDALRSNCRSSLDIYNRAVNRQYGSTLHIDYTDRELLAMAKLRVLDLANTDVYTALGEAKVQKRYFVPVTPCARNKTGFMSLEDVGTKPFIAYGTLTDYVVYELEDIRTICEPICDSGTKPYVNVVRPEDTKKTFSPTELAELGRFVGNWLCDKKLESHITNARCMLENQLASCGIEKLTSQQQSELREVLTALVNAAFYMRKWQGPPQPLPLKASETKGKNLKLHEDKILEFYHKVDTDMKPWCREVLDKMHITNAPAFTPSTVGQLYDGVKSGNECIRMASRSIIITCAKILTNYLGCKLGFNPDLVEPIQ